MAGLPAPIVRNYHAVSLLLPSGKVLSAGSQSATIYLFSPPYLFKGQFPSGVTTRCRIRGRGGRSAITT